MSIVGVLEVQKIDRDVPTILSKNLKEAWDSIITLAESKGVRESFEVEMLSRFDDATHRDEQICQQLTKIFQGNLLLVKAFIQFASTYRSQYYTKNEIAEMLSLFLDFKEKIGEVNCSDIIEKVPHYDQGGKDWIHRCNRALKISKSSIQQVSFLADLPSGKEMKKAEQLGYPLVHRNLFAIDLTSADKYANSLSLNRLFVKSMCGGNPGLSTKTYGDLVELLKKSGKIFSESDQISLMQIIQNLMIHCPTSLQVESGEALIYWYKAVKQTQGEKTFIMVSNPSSFRDDKTLDLQKIILMLQWIVEIGDDADLDSDLLTLYREQTSLTELLDKLEIIKREIEEKKYPEKNIEEVLQAFASSGRGSIPLSPTELKKIEAQFAQIETLGKELRKCDISTLVNKASAIRAKEVLTEDDKMSLIAIAREAIRLKFRISPYNTQVLALLGILNHPIEFKGRIAQVRTGEGKSTIITLLAFYNACLRQTVDIISSSRYLAERDQVKYREFYRLFGISTSHICTDDPTEANFKGQIIFGTNSDFEFAVMWDSIREKRLRTIDMGKLIERPFHVAIVDEVDNLFIDTALNSARISVSSKKGHGWVYQPILSFVKENLSSILSRQNLVSLLREKLANFQGGKFRDSLTSIEDEKLEIWLNSAAAALNKYKLDSDYVVIPIERTSWAGKTTEKEIVLVDKKNTGRLMSGMRAARGVHEFLEAKHNLAIHTESATPASLSHPLFFENYYKIYGLTGTLGSEIERNEIEKIYRVDTFDVPPHKKNLQQLLPPFICYTKESYFMVLLKDIQNMTEQRRPVLILFESIKKSEHFALYLNENGMKFQLLNERQIEHEYFIIARAGAPGMVTVATNTAGRGTDIVLPPESLMQGGLHVISSFYPENDRVEQQGFGRCGRQGQPGTARMILLSKEKSTLEDLIFKREKLTRELSNSRVQKIDIERINHNYLKTFLAGIRRWHDILNADFLKNFQQELIKIVERKPKSASSSDLEGSDLKLSQQFLYYLEHPHVGEHFLEKFIQTAHHLLLDKILLFWAEGFYDKLDELYLSVEKATQENLAVNYKKKIEYLHNSYCAEWEKYLQDPAKGFSEYLQMITCKR